MKQILYISVLLLIFLTSEAVADNCTESGSANGFDSDAVTVTINSFNCVGYGTITAMSLDASIGDDCPYWYDYYISVNGVLIDSGQCNQASYDLTSYLPITSVSIISRDADDVGDYIYLNLTLNITYTPGPGPENPQGLSAVAAGNTENDLSFLPNASSDNVLIIYDTDHTFGTPAGAPPSVGQPFAGGTLIYNGTGSSYQHTGLSAGQDYFYRAFSYDGADYSFGLDAHASTFCDAVTSFPWSEGFENGGSLPDCWTQENTIGNMDWIYYPGSPYDQPDTAHMGNYNAAFYVGNYNGNTTFLITPPMDLSSASNPVLTFWHTQASWGGDQDELRVYYRTSYDGAWTLVPGQEYLGDIPTWTEETEITLPSPSSTYFIGFEAMAAFGYGVCLDDVTVRSAATQWNGNVSTDWANSANWNTGQVPDQQVAVIIPSSPSGGQFPIIANAVVAQCYSLRMEPGANLSIQPGGMLNVTNP